VEDVFLVAARVIEEEVKRMSVKRGAVVLAIVFLVFVGISRGGGFRAVFDDPDPKSQILDVSECGQPGVGTAPGYVAWSLKVRNRYKKTIVATFQWGDDTNTLVRDYKVYGNWTSPQLGTHIERYGQRPPLRVLEARYE
jgi:hypothetical protein